MRHVRQNVLALYDPQGAREDALSKVCAKISQSQPGRDEGRAAELVPNPTLATTMVVLSIAQPPPCGAPRYHRNPLLSTSGTVV